MGISGDAILDDGLPDLGDRRHKNLLKKNKRKGVNGDDSKEDDGQEDDGLELLGFEVMDSEDDSDDAEDPFKLVQRKRAATSIVDEGFNSRRVIKRSKTDPGESKKKKKKDLLSVLLPDNVDSSTIEKDFSIIQESTQMTSMVSHGEHKEDDNNSLKEEDLKSVLEDDENASEHRSDESEGSQDIVLEKIEVYDVAGSKGWYEKNMDNEKGMVDNKKEDQDPNEEQKDERVNAVAETVDEENSLEILDAEAFNKKENVQIDNSVPTDLSEEPNTIKEDSAEAKDPQPSENDSLPAAVTTPKKGTTTTRPIKRKSTLAELCAKKTPIPYRVGLSKRANINHLHSYLSKK